MLQPINMQCICRKEYDVATQPIIFYYWLNIQSDKHDITTPTYIPHQVHFSALIYYTVSPPSTLLLLLFTPTHHILYRTTIYIITGSNSPFSSITEFRFSRVFQVYLEEKLSTVGTQITCGKRLLLTIGNWDTTPYSLSYNAIQYTFRKVQFYITYASGYKPHASAHASKEFLVLQKWPTM